MAMRHKGPRGQISLRAPLPQHRLYEQRAEELGIPAGDYSALILALVHGLDVPEYISKKLNPDQLRLLEVEVQNASQRTAQLAKGA